MRSLVAPKYGLPAEYEVRDVATPTIKGPKDILVKVHAAAIITGDTQLASGKVTMLMGKSEFPIKLGINAAGVVVATAAEVTTLKVGDEVYGMAFGRPMDYSVAPGFCSEYCVGNEDLFVRKPPHVSFEDVTALLGAVLTAVQSIERGLQLMQENGVSGGLEGKTVFVPGALSATGSVGAQLLKAVYGAGRVISTVSTAKVPLVARHLPVGTVDEVIDYTATRRLTDAVPPGSVDFAYNTQWDLGGVIPLLRRDTGVVVSIASVPPSSLLRQMMVAGSVPFYVCWAADLMQCWYAFLMRGTNIGYDFISGNPGAREDLERAAELIALGKVKPLPNVVELEDIAAVRKACEQVYTSKGGLGQLVIKIKRRGAESRSE
ncbi:hypothetical protein DL766_005494 [Monosporascus sp. MC13-8B]|nr:hypothetical protein DL766_005494 [Monosporascus sp. MC13-8B]